ncbi:MAG: carbamoyltransferase [Bacteroidota bacterium]
MKILGISAFYHDSAAALISDSKILSAAQEERFTRKKHDPSFPTNAVRFCLESNGVTIDELDAVVFYDKPLLKFERLIETYYAFAPKGISSFITSIPVWINEKMFLKKVIRESLKEIQPFDKKQLKLLFPEHHLSHSASAFFPSPFEKAAIITIDGVGEWATASISLGYKSEIKILEEMRFPHSLGLLYSAFTYYLGFKVNSGEYKLMGLAPYGRSESEEVKKYISLIKDNLVDIKADGSIYLRQEFFNYATGLRMIYEKKWEKTLGLKKRDPESEIEQDHCDMALAIQIVTEEIVLKMATHAKKITKCDNLCLAGGVALNCVANGKLINSNIFDNVYIQPASGDAGGALGAALAANYLYFNREREVLDNQPSDQMKGSYLGPDYTDRDITLMSKKYKADYTYFDNFDELAHEVASLISQSKVVGWMQGKMEFGPRALGNRSILGDPRDPETQKKLNLKIKYRESFRPFAPSVLEEEKEEFFENNASSPYMLVVQPVKKERRKDLVEGYSELPLKEKLYHLRSDVPAITHIDFSARIQTVNKETNSRYWNLINNFKELTGYGMLVNTSFNVRGEPIICTPEDAYKCFMRTEMDYLVIENYLFEKENQPKWSEINKWEQEYTLD